MLAVHLKLFMASKRRHWVSKNIKAASLLRAMEPHERMVADYALTGVTVVRHLEQGEEIFYLASSDWMWRLGG